MFSCFKKKKKKVKGKAPLDVSRSQNDVAASAGANKVGCVMNFCQVKGYYLYKNTFLCVPSVNVYM